MKVLVASKDHAVFEAMRGARDVEIVSALDTGSIYEAIPSTQLAIVDYGDLIAHPFSKEFLESLVESAKPRLRLCSSAEFINAPGNYLEAKSLRRRSLPFPSRKVIAFTSYSGGTGKTSLALDTAMHFAKCTADVLPLPTAVVEFTYGNSAFQALLGDEQPCLYHLVTEPDQRPQQVRGVTLYPMDYEGVRLLSTDQIARYLRSQIASHVLTVIDTSWPHGLVSSIESEVDLWIVVTTPRVDAVENARRLREELGHEYGEQKAIVAVNQAGGLMTSLALAGTPHELEIPSIQQDDLFAEGRLGRLVLGYVYGPVWREYERVSRRGLRLFRRGR
jgi:hypothetical protein